MNALSPLDSFRATAFPRFTPLRVPPGPRVLAPPRRGRARGVGTRLAAAFLSVILATLLGAPASASGQERPSAPDRPVPYPVFEPPSFTRAVERGTRTRSGRPGPRYWQQRAAYRIEARLDPGAGLLSGRARIRYYNGSPDTLRRVAVHLRQNLFEEGALRLDRTPVTGGMELHRVRAGGTELLALEASTGEQASVDSSAASSAGPTARSKAGSHAASRRDERAGYRVEGTVAWLWPPEPLFPGDTLSIAIAWSYRPAPVPSDGRQGREDGVFFQGYWYPQIAVYDDVSGWTVRPYTGQAEFYMGRADYEVRLTVPPGWVVGATGTLRNPDEVLTERTRDRLEHVREEGGVAALIGSGERGAGRAVRSAGPANTWHFRARDVRDFAWGTSDRYRWDAARALVPPPEGRPALRAEYQPATRPERGGGPAPDTVLVHAFYRPSEEGAAWEKGAARYTRNAVEALSRYLRPYPYPQMTAMEGVLQSGGMEYPMVTVMQPWADTLKLAGDLMHEVGHMWVPMEVGTDEKRFVWMDEALTQFNTAQGMRMIYGPEPRPGRPNDSETGQRRDYLRAEAAGPTVPLMREGDRMPSELYGAIYYDKGAQVLAALRALLGEERFLEAYRAFFDRWWGRHPRPADFFHTFADVTGRDLGWFFRTWFYENWTLDQAIAAVQPEGDSLRITVEDRGFAPMPAPVEIVRTDGSRTVRTIPARVWLEGATRHSILVPRRPAVCRVEIDSKERYPDVDRENQRWSR